MGNYTFVIVLERVIVRLANIHADVFTSHNAGRDTWI